MFNMRIAVLTLVDMAKNNWIKIGYIFFVKKQGEFENQRRKL